MKQYDGDLLIDLLYDIHMCFLKLILKEVYTSTKLESIIKEY